MPESRLAKTRRSLPEGYQFGDMRPAPVSVEGATLMINGVEHILGAPVVFDDSKPVGELFFFKSTPLARMYDHDFTANVIEAEEFASDAERHPVIEGFIAQRDLGDEA